MEINRREEKKPEFTSSIFSLLVPGGADTSNWKVRGRWRRAEGEIDERGGGKMKGGKRERGDQEGGWGSVAKCGEGMGERRREYRRMWKEVETEDAMTDVIGRRRKKWSDERKRTMVDNKIDRNGSGLTFTLKIKSSFRQSVSKFSLDFSHSGSVTRRFKGCLQQLAPN